MLLEAVELRGSQVLNVNRFRHLLWKRRLLLFTTILSIVSILVFVVALASPDWANIVFMNKEDEHVHVQLGVWGEWRTRHDMNHSESVKKLEWIPHFPSPPESVLRLAGTDLKHYYRAQAAFGVISLVLLVANNTLAIYTFYHHRYMYKRLVAMLHAVTGMCIVVTIEVLQSSINEWNRAVASHHDWDYSAGKRGGTSTFMAYACVVVAGIAALVFAVCSGKQKGEEAATVDLEIEDRPVEIGR